MKTDCHERLRLNRCMTVLNKIQVCEFDSPKKLLEKEDSIFSGMVDETNIGSELRLRANAK